jgi:hypothetical protein
MPPKTVTCCICGEVVTNRKSTMFDVGKRCCLTHTDAIAKKRADDAVKTEAMKKNLIDSVMAKIGCRISDLVTKSVKTIDLLISEEYAEFCKINTGFSSSVQSATIKSDCYKLLIDIVSKLEQEICSDRAKKNLFIKQVTNSVHKSWFVCMFKRPEHQRISDDIEAREFFTRYFDARAKLSIIVQLNDNLKNDVLEELEKMGKPRANSYVL